MTDLNPMAHGVFHDYNLAFILIYAVLELWFNTTLDILSVVSFY